jgi:hypothetical protein
MQASFWKLILTNHPRSALDERFALKSPIAVFEMPLGIPGTARHGPYRQHESTLTLFEFAMQLPSCLAVLIAAPMQKPTGAEPRTQSAQVTA